jgi:hypothetical protein
MKNFIIFEQYTPIFILFVIAIILAGIIFLASYLQNKLLKYLSKDKIMILKVYSRLKDQSDYIEMPTSITTDINFMFESLLKTVSNLIVKTKNVKNIVELYILYIEFQKYLKQKNMLITYVNNMF